MLVGFWAAIEWKLDGGWGKVAGVGCMLGAGGVVGLGFGWSLRGSCVEVGWRLGAGWVEVERRIGADWVGLCGGSMEVGWQLRCVAVRR